jgi:hypothetical protein
MRMMKRRTLLLVVIFGIVIVASIWFAQKRVWIAGSMDGGGSEAGQEPVAFGTIQWKSLGGAIIDESKMTYSSPEAARKAFSERLNGAGYVVSSEAERVVKVLGKPYSNEGAAIIITLEAHRFTM